MNAPAVPAASGIVLAGGRSRRFGEDKLAVSLDGSPLLHAPIRALATLCREIIVVLAPDGQEPSLPELGSIPLHLARDAERFGGPLVGILAGLEAAAQRRAIIVGGDMPWLEPAVLGLMLRELGREGADAAALERSGRLEQLPLAVRVAEARPAARRLVEAGERRITALQAELRALAVEESAWRAYDPEAVSIRDVDRPSDLEVERGPRTEG